MARRPRSRFVTVISGLLIVPGVLLMLYPFYTDARAWYYQKIALEQMQDQEVIAPETEPVADPEEDEAENPVVGDPSTELAPPPVKQQPLPPALFIIEIPKVGLKAAVFKGTTPWVLSRGPGWYEQSAMPGEGNTAIAAHRNMYGSQFRNIHTLAVGDRIVLKNGDSKWVYEVEYAQVIPNNDWSLIGPTEYTALTLTTCHKSGRQNRLAVRARLVDEKA